MNSAGYELVICDEWVLVVWVCVVPLFLELLATNELHPPSPFDIDAVMGGRAGSTTLIMGRAVELIHVLLSPRHTRCPLFDLPEFVARSRARDLLRHTSVCAFHARRDRTATPGIHGVESCGPQCGGQVESALEGDVGDLVVVINKASDIRAGVAAIA